MITWLRRRVLPLLLVVAMLASYLPVSAFADEGDTWDIYYASASSISADDIREQFGLSWKDRFRIVTNPDTPDDSVAYDSLNDWGETWSCKNKTTYTLQLGNVFGKNWNTKATFTTRFYSNVTVTSTGAEGGVTISGGSFGTQTVTGEQTFKLYEGETATINVNEVPGYTISNVSAQGVTGENSPYTASYGTDATINVTYAASTETTIRIGETNGANVAYNGNEVSDTVNVEGGSSFDVTITPPANQYVSAVALDGVDASSLTYNGDGTYTATMTAGAAGAAQTLSVTCAPVIGVDALLTVPYTPNVTSAEELRNNILKLVTLPAGVTSDEIKIKYSLFGDTALGGVWIDLNADTITAPVTPFKDYKKIRFIFAGNGNVPGATVTCDYKTVEARQETAITANDVSYGYGEAVTKDKLIEDIAAIVYAGGDQVDGASVTISDSDTVTKLTTGDLEAGTYQITLAYAGDNTYQPATAQVTITITDNRTATRIDVQNDPLEIPYDPDLTEAKLLEMLGVSVVNTVTGETIPDAAVTVKDVEFPLASDDTKTITLAYAGDKNQYQPAECTVTVTVNKADAKVSVGSKVAKYGDTVDASQLITVDPADAKHIDVAVGFGLNDNDETGAVAYVDLPIDLDEILGDNIFSDVVKNIIESVLNEINGKSMSISELSSQLNKLLSAIQDVQEWVDLGIDTSSVDTLIDLLNQVQDLDMQVTVNVTLNQGIQLTNSGAYLVAGIVSDPNYNQAVNLGTVIIAPNAQPAKLAFDYDISNGVITPALLDSGEVSMGAHVEGLEPEDELNTKVSSIFFGVQENNIYIEEEPSSTVGAYTQLSYLADFGNEMSYALPIARAYVVVPDTATITFDRTDATFIYNGEAQGLTATVTDRNGTPIDGAVATLYYTGIQSNGKLYYSHEAPSETGYYTVAATYVSEDKKTAGAAVTTLTIKPAASGITVDDQVSTYSGTPVDVTSLVHSSPAEADVAIMMAGLNVAGGDWSSITGVVNIDLPDSMDEVLKDIVPDAYGNGLNLTFLKQKVLDLRQTMTDAGLDASYLDCFVNLLDQLPDVVTVTLKAQSEVNPSDIGAYLVSASIFDPNYEFKTDTGVVVITPDVTKAELNWNTDIAGGVVTTTMFNSGFDFSAVATVDGVENADFTDKIQYLYIGITADGNSVCTSNASQLTNGAYTEIAYILDDQGTAIDVAKPIVRAFVITPETVTVNLLDQDGNVSNDQTYTYDGTEKAVGVSVTGKDGAAIDTDAGTLCVSYTGVDSLGRFYSSTTAPTQTGYYTVFASYVEKDENDQLVRVGAAMGKLTINAGEATFDLKDTTVNYDGKEKSVDIDNPQNLDSVMVIVDEDDNVNVIFPEAWNVPAAKYDVADAVQKVLDQLGKLPAPIQDRCGSEIVSKLGEILKSIDIKTLQINGDYPIEVGTYKFSAVAFSANYQPVTDAATLVIKKAPTPPSGGDDDNNDNNNNNNNNNNTNNTANNNTQTTTATGNNTASAQTQPQAAAALPQTGDSMPVGLLSGLALVAAAAFVVLLVIRKRKHNN